MIDLAAAQLALRNRAIGLSVCTTGSTTLSATATGYARASGSFVTDGFAVGMEILASGFTSAANNGYAVVTSVSALALGVSGGRTAEAAGSGRTLAVGLPELRRWENTDPLTDGAPSEPTRGRPYIEEDFVPATATVFTFPANGGQVEETGLYVIRWYGLAGTGMSAVRQSVGALRARFSPGTPLTVSGATLRVRADLGPFSGPVRPDGRGWAICTLTVPWLARSVNAVI